MPRSETNPTRATARRVTVLAAVTLGVLTLSAGSSASDAPAAGAPPPRMVWAWERPLDLRFLGADDVGVAFYASTVVVDHDRAFVVPRRTRLRLDVRTYRMAVVRVEPASGSRVTSSREVLDAVVTEVRRVLALPGVRAIQLDFDARASEREAHARLVRVIRDAIPRTTFFSVTTLASHCFGDPLGGASLTAPDEIVPMYFRMGADDGTVRRALRRDHEPDVARCRPSAGIADDESRPSLAPVERVYLFLAGAANETALRRSLASLPTVGVQR